MYKKFFVALTFVLIAFIGIRFTICNAAMPYSEMYLGSLTVGSPFEEMRRIYGEPVYDEGHAEDNYGCHYGNSVNIGYNSYTKKLQSIRVTGNNGWKTPSGLAVGDNISKALDLYGDPDYKQSGNFKTAYCYFHKGYSSYQKKEVKDFGFVILFNKDSGKILELGLWGGNSMASFEETYQYSLKRLVE